MLAWIFNLEEEQNSLQCCCNRGDFSYTEFTDLTASVCEFCIILGIAFYAEIY